MTSELIGGIGGSKRAVRPATSRLYSFSPPCPFQSGQSTHRGQCDGLSVNADASNRGVAPVSSASSIPVRARPIRPVPDR